MSADLGGGSMKLMAGDLMELTGVSFSLSPDVDPDSGSEELRDSDRDTCSGRFPLLEWRLTLRRELRILDRLCFCS